MDSIADLLKNHRVPGVRDSEVRRTCAAAAQSLLKHPITARQVKFKEGRLSFTVPSILRSELKLKEKALKELLLAAGITVTSIA